MSLMDNTLKTKDFYDALNSINVVVNDKDVVHIGLDSLKHKYGVF